MSVEIDNGMSPHKEKTILSDVAGYDRSQNDAKLSNAIEQLKMAGQVQQNFLPAKLPDTDKVRWAAMFQPADWVSGDIYDVTRLDENHMGFYIADAVGHSMPAALLTMFLKEAITLRETTGNQYRIFEPAEVITRLNAKMVAQRLSGCLFATCCYCLFNTATGNLTFVRAGHPYPVLIRKKQKPQQLESRGGLLGVFADGTFEQKSLRLEKGDKIFIYSDGAESVVGQYNEKNEFVFSEQFCSAGACDVKDMMEQFNELVKSLAEKPADLDDITAVGLEVL